MNIFKKCSTMTIFFIFFSLFVWISTSILILTTWNEVKRKAILELRYANEMVLNSFVAELQQHEILLHLLGQQLLEIDGLHNFKHSRLLIEKLLDSDKSLAGFGIARDDGQLVLVSTLPSNIKLPNLLKNPNTRESFQKALHSKNMTLGRTYYMSALKKWVLPIRIPIFDKKGNMAFVMTAGIDLEYKNSPWKLNIVDSPVDNALVGADGYFLYASKATKQSTYAYYGAPVPQSTRKQLNMKEMYTPGTKIFSLYDRYGSKQLILSNYNRRYDFVSASLVPYTKLYRYTYEQLVYFISGIAIFYIFTLLFYLIANKRDKKHEAELLWTANHDILTRLPNRYFLQQKMAQWNKVHLEYSVLFMDLDDFKYINDNYGHPFGDKLLIIVAERLKKIIKFHEFVIRQGGDEFIILTSKSKRNIDSYAKQILERISETVTINNITLHPKISIGIAHFPQDSRGIDSLLSKADMALYKAKKSKLGYFRYSKVLEDISRRRLEIELELRGAVDNGELYVLLQPQMGAKTLKLSGVEALVRWNNAKLGFMPPDQFIKIAEEIGEIHRIGKFVLAEACKICMDIYKTTGKTFTLSVNASVDELLHDGYVDGIMKVVDSLNFPKDLLIIEVTESLLIHDVEQAKKVLSMLRGEGVGVSLDDFGTGYSSLSMLNGLPITELKIDQSFIRDILIDSHDLDLTKSIIMLAKIFNLKTVAEGVEEEGHIQALQDAGCSILQGYYFAKPLTKDELIKFIY